MWLDETAIYSGKLCNQRAAVKIVVGWISIPFTQTLWKQSLFWHTESVVIYIYIESTSQLLYENNSVFKNKALESLSLDIAKGLEFLMKTDQVIEQLLQDFARANVISTVCFHMVFLKATVAFLYPQIIGGHTLTCAIASLTVM